jgi:hypothetical protein
MSALASWFYRYSVQAVHNALEYAFDLTSQSLRDLHLKSVVEDIGCLHDPKVGAKTFVDALSTKRWALLHQGTHHSGTRAGFLDGRRSHRARDSDRIVTSIETT